jgi:hypothetical protein
MRFVIEVVADNREDAADLLRDATRKIKHGKEQHNKEINHCIGDYRVFVGEDLYKTLTVEHAACAKGCGRHVMPGQVLCASCFSPRP